MKEFEINIRENNKLKNYLNKSHLFLNRKFVPEIISKICVE